MAVLEHSFSLFGFSGAHGAPTGPVRASWEVKGVFQVHLLDVSSCWTMRWRESLSWFLPKLFPPHCSGVSGQVQSDFSMHGQRHFLEQATWCSWVSFVLFCLPTLMSLWGKVESSGLMKKISAPLVAYFGWWSQIIPFANGVGLTCCLGGLLSIWRRDEPTWADF